MLKNSIKQNNLWQRISAFFSLNDPKWGRSQNDNASNNDRKPEQRPNNQGNGPPDLDELWRDFSNRLSQLFGGKKRKGNSFNNTNPPTNYQRRGWIGLVIFIVVLTVGWLASSVYIVHEGQAGVVLRFGKYVYTTPAGIQWRLPAPFESSEIVNMAQVRSVEIGRSGMIRATNLKDTSMLTSDENIIDVRFAVQYRIKDAADFLFNNADVETNVVQAAETAVREIVGKSKMDYVLYEGREQVANELAQSIQGILDSYKTGILVTSVTMQNVQPPEQVQAAFDDAVKAGQDRERQKNEAQAYANGVVPLARGSADRVKEEAEGYKARVVSQAEGDASRFDQILVEYAKAPAVTKNRMYLDTMQDIYTHVPKVLIDSKSNNNMIYLPIDKLIDSSNKNANPQPSKNQTEQPKPSQSNANVSASGNDNDRLRSREVFRSRDRSENVR